MIGEIVVFIEDFEFNNKVYKKGHQFKITGVDGMRGYDLEDKDIRPYQSSLKVLNVYSYVYTRDSVS